MSVSEANATQSIRYRPLNISRWSERSSMARLPWETMTDEELEEHMTCCNQDLINGGDGHANSCNA